MKRRLFWKILVGFWLTFIIITQGIWLMFTLLRPDQDVSYMRSFARISVAAASSAIRQGGEPAFETERKTWPQEWRNRIEAEPVTAPLNKRAPIVSDTVSAPDGTNYRVSYYPQSASRNHGIFGIPMEVVIVVVVGGLGFSAILAWYLTQPIQRMQVGFGRLAQGNFGTRLGPAMGRRRDEIADLAHDFDKMAVRLEELVAARDRLLADVSHELRTPLARLNLAIGLARQDPAKMATSLDRISGEAAKLDEMVGELLTLAKLESGQSRGEDYFNFAEVVKAVVQDARYEAAAKGVDVQLDIEPADENFEWIALGSGKLVSRAIENIVRNAVRYSSEGGKVVAVLRHDGGQFRLMVTDEGPGIPEEAMAALFMPFGVSADGFGFGLGLAIAQRAMAVHGGSISARNRQPKGLEMAVTLPAAALEPA
jgi:two-component system OmpR family sensor kinase